MTNNQVQFLNELRPPEATLQDVAYHRCLIGLGRTPVDWNVNVYYKNALAQKVNVTMNDIRQNDLTDTVYSTLGVVFDQELVKIRPFIVELAESSFVQSNVNLTIPQVITELNIRLDNLTQKHLEDIATTKGNIPFTTPEDFVQKMLEIVSDDGLGSQLTKKLVIPRKYLNKLMTPKGNDEHRSWLATMTDYLAVYNTIIVSNTTDALCMFLVVDPYLVQYTGMEPHLCDHGEDNRAHTNWVQFAFSNTFFSNREGKGLLRYELTDGLVQNPLPQPAKKDHGQKQLQ